ncbi:MAG TPA: oligosaccharide flippase family protein [Bryobacteraceae bacterium]|nr:oligosaccharide flippase family protein [Bryobacteraceae bacterium]
MRNSSGQPGTEKTASLTAHVSWLMFAKTIAFIFSLALPMLLVRRLDQAQFGIYKQLFLVIGTSVTVLPLGFAMSAYYFLPREPDRQREAVLNILIYSIAMGILACGAFLLWPVLLDIIFHQPGLTRYAHLIGIVILLWIVSQALEIIPIAHGEMKIASALIIGVQLTRTAIYLAAVIVFESVQALIWAAVVQGILQMAVLWWYLESRFGGFWRRFDWSLMRSQLSYAVPLGLAGILYTVQTDLHSYFVSNRLGAVVFAVYSVGTVDLPLLTMLQEATNTVLIPRVSYLQHINDVREIVLLIARATRKLAAVYFPAYALLAVVAPDLISFVFTRRYLASVPVFRVNLTLLLVSVLLQDPLFRAYQSQRFFLIRLRVILSGLLVAGLYFGTSLFGTVGAISAVVLVTAVERIWTAIRFGRLLGVGRKDLVLLKDIGKLAIAAAASGLVAEGVRLLLRDTHPLVILMVCGVVFSLVYLSAILLAGILTPEEKDIIRRKIAVLLPQT